MRKSLFIIAIIGLLISGYLFITYTVGTPIACGIGHGCDDVRASAYASHFGIPTPAYGILFYLMLAFAALLATSENKQWMRIPLKLFTTIGLLTSVYFTYLEAFIIGAWCIWCVASAILTVLAFGLAMTWRADEKT